MRNQIEEAICNSFGADLNSFLQVLSSLDLWNNDVSEPQYSHINKIKSLMTM
jgi:pantothenate kinase